MVLIATDMLRYLATGLFAFSTLNKTKNHNLIKTSMFSILYMVILATFKCFIIDSPIITVISAVVIFGILAIEYNLKNFKFSIVYSLYITCLTEYIHFFIFESVSKIIDFLNAQEIHSGQPEKLFVGRAIVFILYSIVVLLIYKFKKIDIISINKLADYRIFPLFLSIAMFVITYLKYHIKYTKSNDFHYILSFILVIFILISFVFLFSSEAFLDKIDDLSKQKVNQAVEESKIQNSKEFSKLTFISKELNSEMNYFLTILQEMGMNSEDKKSKQIAYCAVLLNHEQNIQNINMINDIYTYVANILDRQPKTVECNISNAIQSLWNSQDSETIQRINKNYNKPISPETGCPKPKEFLIYLVEKYRYKHQENEVELHSKNSLIKRYFINIQN